MYFATNSADKRFCDAAIEAFLKLNETSPDMRMHALIDAAFDEPGFTLCAKAFKAAAVPVYANTIYSGGLEFGPHLLEIDTTGANAAQEQIQQLLTLRGNRPMLSLWVTTLGPDALAAQWRPFVSARIEDGSSYMLRFADTRILLSLIAVLTPAQNAHFVPGSTKVWMPARNGQYIATESQPEGDHAPVTQLVLSQPQFNTLMDNAEPDAIINQMNEGDAAAYRSAKGADLYSFVNAQIKRARKYHVTQTPDLVTYCELAWTMGPEFDQDEAVNAAMMKVTPSNRLSKVLPEVADKVWQRLEDKHKETGQANL